MLSGSWPLGRSSAPESGKTGTAVGKVRRGLVAPVASHHGHRDLPRLLRALQAKSSDDKTLPPRDRRRVLDAPGLEELHQLLARRLLVPGAVAADDLKQLLGRAGAVALAVQHDRQVEARLVVVRVRLEAPQQVGRLAELFGLRGKLERGAGAGDRRILLLLRRQARREDRAPARARRARRSSGSGRRAPSCCRDRPAARR